MAKEIADSVFDAALGVIDNADELEVRTAASSVLINGVTLDTGNFGSPANYASGGRQMACLVSSTGDMNSIAVSSAGAALRICLLDSAAIVAVTELTSAVSLGASDLVNIGSFLAIFQDPT